VAYDVAHALRRDSLEAHAPLWQAVLGLTDQYVHGRCGSDAYTAAVFELAGRVADAPGADAPGSVALDDGSTVAAFARRKVAYAREYRFPLLRHWSLHEAMLASPYVATQLQTWSEPGRAALSRLLAECGLPLAECKQKFSHMSPAALRSLKQLETVAPRYGLGDVTFWSFTKRHGYKLDVCAADVVHGVTALLEAGGGAHGDATGETAASSQPASGVDASAAGGASGQHSAEGWFWRAVESMSESHWDTLRGGIAEAQRTHRAVMRQAGALLLGGKVAIAGAFRLVNLAGGAAASSAGADVALLRRPATLLRLALLLQDATHAARRSHKPLVLAAPAGPAAGAGSPQSQATGNYGDDDDGGSASAGGMVLVVGVTGRPKRGDTRGNGFGASFHVAAAAVRAPFVHDAFEAAVISVAATHLRPFLLQLQEEELARSAVAEQAAAEAAAAAAEAMAAQQPELQA
jgi:cell division control protein 45